MMKTNEETKSFQAYGTSAAQILLKNESGATNNRYFIYTIDTPTGASKFKVDTTGKVTSSSSFNGTSFNVVSTKESKKNVVPSSIDPLKALDWLKPVEFNYCTESDSDPKHHGLIAEAVAGTPASHIVCVNEYGHPQGIDIANLVSLHTSALKKLKDAISKPSDMPSAQLSNLAGSHQHLACSVSEQGLLIANLQARIIKLEKLHEADVASLSMAQASTISSSINNVKTITNLQSKISELEKDIQLALKAREDEHLKYKLGEIEARFENEIKLLKYALANAKVDLKI